MFAMDSRLRGKDGHLRPYKINILRQPALCKHCPKPCLMFFTETVYSATP